VCQRPGPCEKQSTRGGTRSKRSYHPASPTPTPRTRTPASSTSSAPAVATATTTTIRPVSCYATTDEHAGGAPCISRAPHSNANSPITLIIGGRNGPQNPSSPRGRYRRNGRYEHGHVRARRRRVRNRPERRQRSPAALRAGEVDGSGPPYRRSRAARHGRRHGLRWVEDSPGGVRERIRGLRAGPHPRRRSRGVRRGELIERPYRVWFRAARMGVRASLLRRSADERESCQ